MALALGVRKEAGQRDGMVCWYPPPELAEALVTDCGDCGRCGEESVTAEDLHVTLAYLPEVDEVRVSELHGVVERVAAAHGEVAGSIQGSAKFVTGPLEDCAVLLVDSPDLHELRRALVTELEVAGFTVARDHSFTPHLTLRYGKAGTVYPPDLVREIPVVIDVLSTVTRSGQRTNAPLGLTTVEYSVTVREKLSATLADGSPDWATRISAARDLEPAQKAWNFFAWALGEEEPADERCAFCSATATRKLWSNGRKHVAVCDDCRSRAFGLAKLNDEWRYTLGPVYAPDTLDLHDEFADDAELHRAFIEYAALSDRRLRLQHNTDVEVGTVVELMRVPWEHTVQLSAPGRDTYEVTLPAGTVWMGVVWDERPWNELVKTGKIGGYSMGGRAFRSLTQETPARPEKRAA